MPLVAALTGAVLIASCGSALRAHVAYSASAIASDPRVRFNQAAARLNLPVLWAGDIDGDGRPGAAELRELVLYGASSEALIVDGELTQAGWATIGLIETEREASMPSDVAHLLVRRELDAMVPSLVEAAPSSTTTNRSDADLNLIRRMLRIAEAIDGLYSRQLGLERLVDRIPATERASWSLVRREWGTECRVITEPACSAILDGEPFHAVLSVYPAAEQSRPDFCWHYADGVAPDQLPDDLMSPFTVIEDTDAGGLVTRSYHEAYPDLMDVIADELEALGAVARAGGDPALAGYTDAMAEAFGPAGRPSDRDAWRTMAMSNSRLFVTLGANDLSWDPCGHKYAFGMTFGRIDSDALVWEEQIASGLNELRGAVTEASDGLLALPLGDALQMPEPVQLMFRAGVDRRAGGATLGYERLGRAVVFTNLHSSVDGRLIVEAEAARLLDAEAMSRSDGVGELVMTSLHEAVHSLTPSRGYIGRPDATDVVSEMVADVGALFLIDLLADRGTIDSSRLEAAYVDYLRTAFGAAASPMYRRGLRTHHQAATIVLGLLIEAGALRWDSSEVAADGTAGGAFHVDFHRMRESAPGLLGRIARLITSQEQHEFELLSAAYVDGSALPRALFRDRLATVPFAEHVYPRPR